MTSMTSSHSRRLTFKSLETWARASVACIVCDTSELTSPVTYTVLHGNNGIALANNVHRFTHSPHCFIFELYSLKFDCILTADEILKRTAHYLGLFRTINYKVYQSLYIHSWSHLYMWNNLVRHSMQIK